MDQKIRRTKSTFQAHPRTSPPIDRKTASPSPYDITNETVRITEIINGRKTRRFYGWAIPEDARDTTYKGILNAWEITTYKPAD